MNSSARYLVLLGALLVWGPFTTLSAQEPDLLAPPHLSVIDGAANFERDGQVLEAEPGRILLIGDRFRTRNGRAEILFGDGSALHLDAYSSVDLLDAGLLRLLEGQVFLHVATAADGFDPVEYRIDTPAASVRTSDAGEYRVSILTEPDATTELAVARGLAWVVTNRGQAALRAGERARTRVGQSPGRVVAYNVAAWDEFERWSYAQRRASFDDRSYLPRELTAYAPTLDRHGSWTHHSTYGAVWYPRVVVGWRPFFHGHWTVLAPYGWTWIGVDPWAWPTHYYGQWNVTAAGRWFWIPGRRFGPARVRWTFDARGIGWAPQGAGRVSRVGLTVLPRRVFQSNVHVPRHALAVPTRGRATGWTFVSQAPPVPSGVAVPRASVITRMAVPRRAATRRGPVVPRATGRIATTDLRRAPPGAGVVRERRAGTMRRAPQGLAEPEQRPTTRFRVRNRRSQSGRPTGTAAGSGAPGMRLRTRRAEPAGRVGAASGARRDARTGTSRAAVPAPRETRRSVPAGGFRVRPSTSADRPAGGRLAVPRSRSAAPTSGGRASGIRSSGVTPTPPRGARPTSGAPQVGAPVGRSGGRPTGVVVTPRVPRTSTAGAISGGRTARGR